MRVCARARVYVCACVLVRARARACVCVSVCVCVHVPACACEHTCLLLTQICLIPSFRADPTTITKFTIATEDTHLEVDENKEPGVKARCEWQEGNPQRRIHIRKDGDEPLHTMETADRRLSTLVHNIRPVRCSDSGLYSCEVEGTAQHRTVTMLVRCKYNKVTGRYRCKYAMTVISAGISIQ